MTAGFGLSKFKKIIKEKIIVKYCEQIIVGHDKYCVKAAELMLEQNPDLKLLIIREEVDDLFNETLCTLRGEENLNVLKNLNMKFDERGPSVFYKDLNFYDFGKRAKSVTLQNTEPFFTQNSVDLNIEKSSYFTGSWQELEKKYPQIILVDVPVLNIEKTDPDDLVNQNNYKIALTDNTYYSCKNLTWGHSPYCFLNKFQNKSLLKDSFISFCETTKGPMSLSIKFTLDTEKFYQNKTFFIPLSYTHDWGHFIGEFISKNEIIFVHYVGEEGLDKSDVEKRIRLLKRQLEKAFLKFDESVQDMQVKFEDESASLNIEDLMTQNDLPEQLTFIGENSYLSQNKQKNISNFTRGLLSIENLITSSI